MTEGVEHALEHVFAGVLFCIAVTMLLWLHGMFMQQVQSAGKEPERLILFEEDGGWKH